MIMMMMMNDDDVVVDADLFATVRLGSSVQGLCKNVVCGQSDACSRLL